MYCGRSFRQKYRAYKLAKIASTFSFVLTYLDWKKLIVLSNNNEMSIGSEKAPFGHPLIEPLYMP